MLSSSRRAGKSGAGFSTLSRYRAAALGSSTAASAAAGGSGVQPESATTAAAVRVMLHAPEQLDLLLAAKLEAPPALWLKVDTGMHRLGLAPDALLPTLDALRAAALVATPPVVCTHLASADARENPQTERQLGVFDTLTRGLDLPLSIANSAGILA